MGKLMKYELRSAMKLFVPLWIAALVLAFVNSLTLNVEVEQLSNTVLRFMASLSMIAYTVTVIAIVLVAVIYVVLRFYQATMKDEGYLTFTLPVSIDSILWSKAMSGILILVISMGVALLSVLLVNWRAIDPKDIGILWNNIVESPYCLDYLFSFVVFLVVVVTGFASTLFHIYLSMGIGQMNNKHKIGLSVLAYVGINIVVTTLAGTVLGPVFITLIEDWDVIEFFKMFNEGQIIWVALLLVVLYNVIFTAIYYFPTRAIFKNNLNLE